MSEFDDSIFRVCVSLPCMIKGTLKVQQERIIHAAILNGLNEQRSSECTMQRFYKWLLDSEESMFSLVLSNQQFDLFFFPKNWAETTCF